MSSIYTLTCNHCGRRNSRASARCVNCGSQIKIQPHTRSRNYSRPIPRKVPQKKQTIPAKKIIRISNNPPVRYSNSPFSFYQTYGIANSRKRGGVRILMGLGLILFGVLLLSTFSNIFDGLIFALLLLFTYGAGSIQIGAFELISNRGFHQITPRARWMVILIPIVGGCLLMFLIFFIQGILYSR